MSTFACPVHTFSRWGGEHRNCSDAHCGNHSIIGHLLCTRADGIFLRQVLTAAPRGGSHCYPILEINRDTKELGMGVAAMPVLGFQSLNSSLTRIIFYQNQRGDACILWDT